MGQVISAGAAMDRIEADVRTAEQNARVRGGEIAAAAAARLEPAIANMDNARTILNGAKAAESAAWTVVFVRNEEGDIVIGGTRDEMWNELGRVRQHPAMDHTFPGGIRTYTEGDPKGQPVLMQVLTSRIPTAEAPQWTPEKRAG